MDKIERPLDVTWDDLRPWSLQKFRKKHFSVRKVVILFCSSAGLLGYIVCLSFVPKTTNARTVTTGAASIKKMPVVVSPALPQALSFCEILKRQSSASALERGHNLRQHCLRGN